MRRRLVRPHRSKFKVGQKVRIENDYCGDFVGTVVKIYQRLSVCTEDGPKTGPGLWVKINDQESIEVLEEQATPTTPRRTS